MPLLIGGFGPSGGGKTFSALRLATGIQSITGGDIGFVDTEARRALHYADQFKFRHVDFKVPFGPLDYLAAIRHFEGKGVKTIIVDSMSHEHEGQGGVLDQHETIMGGNEARSMLAWKVPKSQRRELINSVLQMSVNFIFCFRAKEKVKPVRNQNGKMEPKNQGFMPIAGEEFLFEMTVCYLLMPRANGVPEWNPVEPGERMMCKLPEQFFEILKETKPLDEQTGVKLAEWARGGISTSQPAERAIEITSKMLVPPPSQESNRQSAHNPPSEPCADLEEQQFGGPKEVSGEVSIAQSKNPQYTNLRCTGKFYSFKKSNFPRLTDEIEARIKSGKIRYRILFTETPWEREGKSGVNNIAVCVEPI